MSFTDSSSQVFALIIGINEYKSDDVPNLKGAVNDANLMKSYVSKDLRTPDSHVTFLFNKFATRSAIISAFNTLIKNDEIKENDTIIIFYAGHGSRMKAPDGWITSDGQIETLLPYDIDGVSIHSIPDRTVMALLRELADAKGNNITVIFDCCYSGGLARDVAPETELTVRSVTLPYVMPETLDKDIWSPEVARGQRKHDKFRFDVMSSRVLLAACRGNERAYECTVEEPVYGFFTQGLIRQLRETKTTHRTTYSALMDSLVNTFQEQGRSQVPQCEGTNKIRAVFSGQLAGKLKGFTLTRIEGNKAFKVAAGYFQGVVKGTEFVVQNQKPETDDWEDLGHMVGTTVNASSSTLVPRDAEFPVPDGSIALVSNWKNELKVFVHADSKEREKLESEIDHEQSPQKAFVRVGSQADAQVVIKLESHGKDRKLHIERQDGLMSRYAKELCVGLPRTLPPALDQIAHFNYHLGRYHGEGFLQDVARNRHDTLGDVSMKLYRLIRKGFRVPDTKVGNLLIENEAKLKFKLDEDAEYGIEIINNTDRDLFPYLFYFDPSDYSIQLWYSPACLAANPPLGRLQGQEPGRVTVGYGAGGGDPIEFTLKEGQQSDAGFMKLFVTTSAVDMSNIVQISPFSGENGRPAKKKDIHDVTWGAIVAAVVVSRENASVE